MASDPGGGKKKRYALYIGCTVAQKCLNYEVSARKVAEALGIELVTLPDFGCCGFPASLDHDLNMAMAARNIALAEEKGLDMVTLCSACTANISKVNNLIRSSMEERARVNGMLASIGHEVKGTIEIKHITRVLFEDVGIDCIRRKVTRPLKDIKIAAHYGCHYMKPSEVFGGFDDPILPRGLDSLIEATGATSVPYEDKYQCCGGGVLAVDESVPIKMVGNKLEHVRTAGADAIVLMCPFCDTMYDEYQRTVEERLGKEFGIPVLYLTQLLGLALGLDPKKDLFINKNAVKAKALLAKLGL